MPMKSRRWKTMFPNLESAQAAIEAILFATAQPVHVDDLAYAVGLDSDAVRALLRQVEERFSRPESGAMLTCVEGCYLLQSRPEYSRYVERLCNRQKPAQLSAASLETLAIIVYKQPVTRGEVERIRGVNCDSAISTLLERGLIAEAGRKNTIGRPILYVTTPEFLLHMGISSVDQLPPIPDGGADADGEAGAHAGASEGVAPVDQAGEPAGPKLPGFK